MHGAGDGRRRHSSGRAQGAVEQFLQHRRLHAQQGGLILDGLPAWRDFDGRVVAAALRAWLRPLPDLLAACLYSSLEKLGHRPKHAFVPPFAPPVAARLAAMLRSGDFDTLRYTLSRLHPESLSAVLEATLDVLDADERSTQWLERLWQWYRGNRESLPLMAVIHGQLRHAALCQVRGKRGQDEGAEALAEAERLLERALTAQPDSADLLDLRLLTARGLRLPLTEHWARFRALLQVAPRHYRGHLDMLENLRAGVCGSHEAMFRFARARAGQLPACSLLRALPLRAHFAMVEAMAAAGDAAAALVWFGREEVADEIVGIWQELEGVLAEQGNAQADEVLNQFAVALYAAGHAGLAATALEAMDGRCMAATWRFLANNERERHNPGWVADRIKAEIAGKTALPVQ